MTLEQLRASDALAKVRLAQKRDTACMYRSYVERLPATIVMNGLGQALATELAAGGEGSEHSEHRNLYADLASWLCSANGPYRGKTDLLDAILNGSEDDYLVAQAEALAWLDWHKKFCRAFLPGE